MYKNLTSEELKMIREEYMKGAPAPSNSKAIRTMLLFAIFFVIIVIVGYLLISVGSSLI